MAWLRGVRRMKTTCKRRALPRCLLQLALASTAAWATHCDPTDYPVEPTFCDDWCHMLLRAGCDQEPENCVRTCERSLGPRECFELHAELLRCYRATPPSQFVCSEQGFQEIPRPEERVCQPERDALIECAYPEVKLCLDVCRAAEAASAADAALDASTPPGRTCPSYDIPCDSICWIARGRLEPSHDDAGADAGSAADGGGELGHGAGQLIACALDRAERCHSPETDAGSANWSSVLLDCAAELGL
jgi:hypothetical protein